MIRRFVALLTLALTAALTQAVSASNAEATSNPWRWYGTPSNGQLTVCVEDRTWHPNGWDRWAVKSAVENVNTVPDIRLLYRRWSDCGSFSRVIRVYDGWYSDKSWVGRTEVYCNSVKACQLTLDYDRSIRHVKTYLNRAKLPSGASWSYRKHVTVHELLHGLGEAHSPKGTRSIMAIETGWNYYTVQSYDKADVGRLYPW